MTRRYYTETYDSYNTNYSTFRGVIYKGDFDHYHSLSDMAERIMSDWKFDEQCRKNAENRDRQKKNLDKDVQNDKKK